MGYLFLHCNHSTSDILSYRDNKISPKNVYMILEASIRMTNHFFALNPII